MPIGLTLNQSCCSLVESNQPADTLQKECQNKTRNRALKMAWHNSMPSAVRKIITMIKAATAAAIIKLMEAS